MKIYYNPKLKEVARQLRKNCTQAEIKLWQYLKRGQMYEYDFHRQKPIDNYIADFFCNKLELVIEVDGATHFDDDVFKRDKQKQARLEDLGLKVLRFQDDDVLNNIEGVLAVIERYVLEFENGSNKA